MLDALVERVAARDARHRPALSLVEISPCATLHFSLMILHPASAHALFNACPRWGTFSWHTASCGYFWDSRCLKGAGAF